MIYAPTLIRLYDICSCVNHHTLHSKISINLETFKKKALLVKPLSQVIFKTF